MVRLQLRQWAERAGRQDRAVHALLVPRGRRGDRARRDRSQWALRGPRRRPLAIHSRHGPSEARPRPEAFCPLRSRSHGFEHAAERHRAHGLRGCGRRDVGRHPERSRTRHPEATAVCQLHAPRHRPGQPYRRHDPVRAGRQPRRPLDRDGNGPPAARSTDTTAHSLSPQPEESRQPVLRQGLRHSRGPLGRAVDRHPRRRPRPLRCRDRTIRSLSSRPEGPAQPGQRPRAERVLRSERRAVGGDAGRRAEPVRSRVGPLHSRSELWAVLRQVNFRGPSRDPLACGQ